MYTGGQQKPIFIQALSQTITMHYSFAALMASVWATSAFSASVSASLSLTCKTWKNAVGTCENRGCMWMFNGCLMDVEWMLNGWWMTLNRCLVYTKPPECPPLWCLGMLWPPRNHRRHFGLLDFLLQNMTCENLWTEKSHWFWFYIFYLKSPSRLVCKTYPSSNINQWSGFMQ